MRRAIRNADARIWFLPAYSPDLNPIEQTFAKIKITPRNAPPSLAPFDTIQPDECQNYIRAGYGSN